MNLPFMKILCAVDFSETSASAAAYASALAAHTGASLDLIFVQPLMVASVEADPTFSASLFEELRQQNQITLSEWAARYKARDYHLRIGSAVEEITAFAREEGYAVIVCGQTGSGAAQAVIFGSTTSGLIHHSKVPVLVIHKDEVWQPFQNILLATDLENLPPDLPEFFKSWVRLFKAHMTLLYVAGIEEDLPEEKVHEALSWAGRQFPGLVVQFRNYFSEDRVLGIEETADALATDLVVVVHRQRNFFQRIVHPAFSARVARNLRKPLLVLEL